MSISTTKKRTFFCKKIRFSLVHLLCASAFEPKHAVRDKRRKDQPKRGKRNDRIGDDRAHRSRARKYLRNEIKIEQPEQTPVDRTDDYQNIRDNVDHSHNLPSCKQYAPLFENYAKEFCASFRPRQNALKLSLFCPQSNHGIFLCRRRSRN